MMPTTNTEISHQRKSSSSISLSQSIQSVSVQVHISRHWTDTDAIAMPGAILTNSIINSNLVILMSKAPGYWPALSSHSHLTRLRFRRHLHFYSLGQSLVWWWTIDSWLSKQWTLENEDSRKMNYESVTFLFIWILWVIFSISLLSSDLFFTIFIHKDIFRK